MTTPSQILDAAMALDTAQRAEVAHQLQLSLEPADFDEDADQAWAAEVRRRLRAIRQGDVVLRDWDEPVGKGASPSTKECVKAGCRVPGA